MMVECKSMDVPLSEDVLNQVLRYNVSVPVQFLVITNGTHCMAFEKRNMQLVPLNEFPEFQIHPGRIAGSILFIFVPMRPPLHGEDWQRLTGIS